MKLSRKRHVVTTTTDGPSKGRDDQIENDKLKKSGQTKISKFFSKAILPAAITENKLSKSAKSTIASKIDEEEIREEPDEIIDRTPEAALTASDRWRANRFCRLKKTATSVSSLRSFKSSTSVVALVTSTPTPSSLSPKSKRGKFETTPEKIKEKDFDDVSPVAVCKRSPPKSEKISKIENEELLKLVRTQKTSSKVSLETLEIFSKNEAETPSPSANLCPPSVNEKPLSHKYGRHRVVDVLRPQGRYGEIDVRLESDDAEKKPVRCILRGSWANTNLYEGDIVNMLNLNEAICEEDNVSTYLIDDSSGLLVVHPDHLLSGTSIVSSLFCTRKAVLAERFKGLEGNNRTMFVGTLVHVLLQECLRFESRSAEDVAHQFERVLKMSNIRLDMLGLGMSEKDVRQEVDPFVPHVVFFIERYVMGRDVAVPAAAYSNTGGGGPQRSFGGRPPPPTQVWPGSVETVKDIEENIWSPRLGIKGKVDITVQVKLQNRDNKGRLCKTLPLELKTGRPSGSSEHRGQVIIYSMMMSERRPDPEAGLLLYLRTSSLQEVQAGINEMRGLVQLRNQLASSVRDQDKLPDPINLKRACEQCAHLPVCAAYQQLQNSVPAAPHAMSELVPASISHLQVEDLEFFQKWSKMCALETGEALRANRLKNLWTQTPQRREINLSAIADLKLKSHSNGLGETNQFCHTFHRELSIPTINIFHTGDAVIVSTDSALAMSQGVVRSITSEEIVLSLDRDLQQWSGGDNRFHVDRYEYQQTAGGANLNNLAKLMSNNPRAEKLRKIVITGKIPATFVPGLPREVATKGKHILRPLNRVQQKAIFRTIMAEEYVLIRGMPGSGKTTAIVALIRLLVALGKTVLLTSYTHSAVDNVLIKLIHEDVDGAAPFLRVGQVSRIHPEVLPHSADILSQDFNGDVTSLKAMFQSRPVVASTCLGINHPSIAGRTFDYCIFDEAGQALLLATLGPLFHCDKFVLVGDPQQLPPVVQSSEARQLGLENSLFAHLENEENVIPLTLQYRMNRDIQAMANHLTYNNQLECGSDDVSKRTLFCLETSLLPNSDKRSWMEHLSDTNIEMSVLFLDTTDLGPVERQNDAGVCNDLEAEIVVQVYDRLKEMSTQKDQQKPPTIGVIAPYRAQVSNLRKFLSNSVADPSSINTVDQFQGRDQDVIIYSCTRCRPKVAVDENKKHSVDILSDHRRLNVAVTRAKAKLVIVGHGDALLSYDPFKAMIEYLKSKDRIIRLKLEDIF